jgi:hypothetical protein
MCNVATGDGRELLNRRSVYLNQLKVECGMIPPVTIKNDEAQHLIDLA